MKPNEKCYLINAKLSKTLAYKKTKKGISLVFVALKKTPLNIIFKDTNHDGLLDTNDVMAIQVIDGAYLKYEAREYGINIVWSQTPVYEWTISSDDKSVLSIQNNKKSEAVGVIHSWLTLIFFYCYSFRWRLIYKSVVSTQKINCKKSITICPVMLFL